jgi:hypothetical protein
VRLGIGVPFQVRATIVASSEGERAGCVSGFCISCQAWSFHVSGNHRLLTLPTVYGTQEYPVSGVPGGWPWIGRDMTSADNAVFIAIG